jgi:hypothetical protein
MLSLLEEYKLLPDAQNTLLNAFLNRPSASAGCQRRRAMRCSWPDVRCKPVRCMAGENQSV